MKKMTADDFKQLVGCCLAYDSFPQYIDDYRQEQASRRSNAKFAEKFFTILNQYTDSEVKYMPNDCLNARIDAVKERLAKWLAEKFDIEVEAEQPKPKRVWTEDEIKNYVQTNDKVLYGALKNLYACQTADEQTNSTTTHANGAGFNATDADYLTSVSKFLIKNGYLTDKQKACVRKKLVKYNKQLTRLANA